MRIWHDLGVKDPELPSVGQLVWLHNDQPTVHLAFISNDRKWTNPSGDVHFQKAMAWTPMEDMPKPPRFRRIWEAT